MPEEVLVHTSDEGSRQQALLQCSPDLLYVVSRDGLVCSANKQACVVGTHVAEHVAVDRAAIEATLARVLHTGEGEEHVFQAGPDGAGRWYRARMERCGQGTCAEVLLYVTDVTEQRRAEEALLGTVREL